tara:strand:+ start:437 stop:1783 length:1347 start_codon:yes stop_codon:yes gene_type:complete
MKIKANIPKGMRDFSSEIVSRRNFIFDTIREVFECYGYAPIETPAMENRVTLTGKYGDEGDRLIFKVLNSGDFLSKLDLKENTTSNSLSTKISDKALRYDLTVPFARYVVQNRNELTFPFKRYQMQNVWRADKPQKGRYREFYQCDADVIGTDSLLCEIELIQLYDDVFNRLQLPNMQICLNNRKILSGMIELMDAESQAEKVLILLDKIGKRDSEKLKQELFNLNINQESYNILASFLQAKTIQEIDELVSESIIGKEGVKEIKFILEKINNLSLKSTDINFDISLARGLDYYTGSILEAKIKGLDIGSLGGGGRYDDLTGIFGLDNMSGVGISFGLDRIYLAMEEMDCFPNDIIQTTDVMFVNFGDKEVNYCLPLLKELRENGISSEIYPESVKLKKQMNYANNKDIKIVVMIGEDEIQSELLSIKYMKTGKQEKLNLKDLIKIFK